MTNREWVNRLSNEDFVTWLTGPIEWDSEKEECKEPHLRLEYLKRTSTNFFNSFQEWLKEERKCVKTLDK